MNEMIRILYKDETLAVAVKPVGVLSQPDRTGEASMITLLKEQLGREVFPIHRLDRAVGGVMVFAMTKAAAGKLSGMVGTDAFEKEYLAVVHGAPTEEKGEFTDYLYHDPKRNFTSVVPKTQKDAKEAKLTYTLLGKDMEKEFSLVRVRLYTGRTHQIRVQFSSRGMSIAGDGKYGSRDRMSLALWSYYLSFRHPIRKKTMTFKALPDGKTEPWDRFSF
ncbi:MAG: RluA family pseudouridine synthase [Ruminococcaceae bacterium]|nr:RluA family pseudouridine synthase [Oscillospiraceae bacterium]